MHATGVRGRLNCCVTAICQDSRPSRCFHTAAGARPAIPPLKPLPWCTETSDLFTRDVLSGDGWEGVLRGGSSEGGGTLTGGGLVAGGARYQCAFRGLELLHRQIDHDVRLVTSSGGATRGCQPIGRNRRDEALGAGCGVLREAAAALGPAPFKVRVTRDDSACPCGECGNHLRPPLCKV